jgi:hypothetical protein
VCCLHQYVGVLLAGCTRSDWSAHTSQRPSICDLFGKETTDETERCHHTIFCSVLSEMPWGTV